MCFIQFLHFYISLYLFAIALFCLKISSKRTKCIIYTYLIGNTQLVILSKHVAEQMGAGVGSLIAGLSSKSR